MKKYLLLLALVCLLGNRGLAQNSSTTFWESYPDVLDFDAWRLQAAFKGKARSKAADAAFKGIRSKGAHPESISRTTAPPHRRKAEWLNKKK